MAVTLGDAEAYFAVNVLHNEEWTEADAARKQRALTNAKNILYRVYKNYNETTKPLPDAAVFEQALWLLRADEAIRRSEFGVNSVTVGGMQISIERINTTVAPQAALIIGRRVGRSAG